METTEPKKSVSPAQFVQQVRQEVSRVTWPTRKETLISTAMVLILCVIAALFFLVVDSIISNAVKWFLGVSF